MSVLRVTFGVTVLLDLTYDIVAGCVVAAVIAISHRFVSEKDAPARTE